MTSRHRAGRTLRWSLAPLLLLSVGVHLWISSRLGLAMIGGLLVTHVAAGLIGGHLVRRRRSARASD
ncbi:hypothetical protein [Actinoallomurus acanthiterrae]